MGSEYFETRFAVNRNRQKVWQKLTPYFQKFISEEDTLLELGAGYCYFINKIKSARKIGVDTFEKLDFYSNDDVETHVEDARYLSFIETASVDVIFASNFLEHFDWDDLELLMIEILRVLKANGKIIIMQPNFRLSYKNYFDDYTHRTIFTDLSMVDWFQSKGFTTEIKRPRFMPFSVKRTSGSLHWLIPLYLRSPLKPFAGQMMFVFKNQKRPT